MLYVYVQTEIDWGKNCMVVWISVTLNPACCNNSLSEQNSPNL